MYSSHIFMFPFRFDWNEKGFDNKFDFYKSNHIDKRLNLEKLKNLLDKDWRYESFNLKNDLKNKKDYMYNEFAYFYDYARDAIYNQGISKDSISYYFERKDNLENSSYIIHIKKDKECYKYNLNIVGLSLRVFTSGIAILSIELENRVHKELDDILRINDYGRRIYPQFIANGSSQATKNSFLADYITIKTSDINITENFEYPNFSDTCIGSHIIKLLGEKTFTQNKSAKNTFYIQPILDDRMFVISWYENIDFSNKLIDKKYIHDDDWYKYVFIDGNGKTIYSNTMQTELIKEASYDRWMNYTYNNECSLTLYGISKYSFVCLSTTDFPLIHMQSMYFQMTTLLLATRASILRFSDEVAAIANSKDIDKVEKLYEKYLTFYNRLYFKEVTHQEQGIELYNIARKQMNIDEHIEKLDVKFTKLFEFANLKSEKENSKKMDTLNIMGAIFLPPTLLVALFSMGIYDYHKSLISLSVGLLATLASGFLGYFAIKSIITKGIHSE